MTPHEKAIAYMCNQLDVAIDKVAILGNFSTTVSIDFYLPEVIEYLKMKGCKIWVQKREKAILHPEITEFCVISWE